MCWLEKRDQAPQGPGVHKGGFIFGQDTAKWVNEASRREARLGCPNQARGPRVPDICLSRHRSPRPRALALWQAYVVWA